jgi:hypothetical protein
MKKPILIALCCIALSAHAEEPQVCASERQAVELFRGVMEMSVTINRQRAEIETLKRLLAEHGIEYVPAWQQFVRQVEELRVTQ